MRDIIENIEKWNIKAKHMPESQEDRLRKWRNDSSYRELAEVIFEEEVIEIFQSGNDTVKLVDGFADALYTLIGMVVKSGLQEPFVDAVYEVMRSNDSKLEGDVKVLNNGKIGKGDRYSPPNISGILDKHGIDY